MVKKLYTIVKVSAVALAAIVGFITMCTAIFFGMVHILPQ